MKKKFQVFVSSTYKDLIDERREVFDILTTINCFPVAMEFFSAAPDEKWDRIKKTIDECDYFITIVAGEYGSIYEKEKKSFTQLEYEYAKEKEIPVLSFVHENIESLEKNETDPAQKKLLLDFIKKVENDSVAGKWKDEKDLAIKVSTSISNLIKDNPRIGWVKASDLKSPDDVRLSCEFDMIQTMSTFFTTASSSDIFVMGSVKAAPLFLEAISNNKNAPKIRLLLMDPNGHSCKVAALRAGEDYGKIKKQYQQNLDMIMGFVNEHPNKEFECRIIDYLPPYNLFISDGDEEVGKMEVRLSAWREAVQNRPALTLSKQENESWFLLFRNEFNTLWEEGHIPINGEDYGIEK